MFWIDVQSILDKTGDKKRPCAATGRRRPAVGGSPAAGAAERLAKLYDNLLALCKADPGKAAKLARPNAPAGTDAAEAAGRTALARAMLNLDEFVTRE